MNIKSLSVVIILFELLLNACAPRATPYTDIKSVEVVKEQKPVVTVPQGASAPTSAPLAAQPRLPAPTAAPVLVQPQQPAPTSLPLPGTVPTPSDNTFQNYGINPFVDTSEDHLSTFALDVDTASYAVARSYVKDGNQPPAEAIRVEEFVNYFNQGYPTPENIAFGIYADGAPSPFHYDNTYILRFGIQGYRVPEWQRKPLSLTFVIDVSGSMRENNRLELVKQSLKMLVDRLDPEDTVAIVVYSTNTRVVLNPTNDRNLITNAIYDLHPEQTTNVEAGLRLGYQVAMQAYRSGATNRVILCSDGVANVGQTDPKAILSEVRGYVDEGVTLTTVGVGMGNYNDVLLEQLADNGNGNYAYMDTPEEARKLFVENLTSTMQVIALNAKVQVDFNPDIVYRYRLIGYENRAVADQDFRNDAVDAGEIGAGHSATALYAVQFKPNAQGRIATVQLRWEDPQTRQVQEINGNFNTWDMAATFENASPYYQLSVVTAQYAEILRHSPWGASSAPYMVVQHASRLTSLFPNEPDVIEFANLVSRAFQIGALGE